MEERVRSEILGQMEEILSVEQLSILVDVLAKVLRVYKVERANELVVYDRSNDKLLNLFIASLRLEGKAESTLFQYRLAVTDMLWCVGKRIPNVTMNDIRFYLAEYQRKGVSKLTVDNRRRCLSSFFAWLTVEEYIVKNPMLRIKKTEAISDKWIPLILCVARIVLAAIYVVAVSLPFSSSGETLMAVFTAVVQGVLCAALSTFVNQLIKQSKKDE